MSFIFLLAQGEESSADCFADMLRSAPLSWRNTLGESFSSVSGTDSSHGSQSGTMSAPSMEAPGAEPWTSSLEASPARTSAALVGELESKASALGFGPSSRESLAKWDPASSSWKTPHCSLFEGWDEFSGTWPRWGSMRAGVCWARTMPELRTSESGSGFLPTPTATNTKAIHQRSGGRPPRSYWSTPLASDAKGSLGVHRGNGKPKSNLAREVKMWPTPQAHDAHKGNPARVGRFGTKHGGRNLNDEVAKWPTPKARDYRTGDKPESRRAREKASGERHSPDLNDVAAPGGQLNPDWVEWLMGWPIGWTALEPLGTDKFRQWLNSHLQLSRSA